MAKQKFTLADCVQLNHELFLLQGEKELNFALKYSISKVFDKTTKITKDFNSLRNKIIEKYGSLVPDSKDQYTLDGSKDEEKGIQELEALSEKTEEFEVEFKLEDFKDFKSENRYIYFMKLVK